ncbi:MAG TPA: hypothetical protein DEA08_33030, partial [Planctomycetes bacterium]|nr:hypothetical protein [Planctomycetota bacterium]
MGAVYAARHVQTGARVALKQVLVVDEDPDTLARFEVEARALARVRHPQVVQLLEVGRDARGRPWIAMELVEGESLDEVLRRDGPLPAARALELVRPLVAALAHAHERGVVHRDLKPSNVLVRGRDGAPLLTDFGLAKRLDQSQALTQTGEVLGTPGYLAPEQCGVSGGVGPATDVYGLGALLYALLTGQPPCRGATLIDSLRHVIEVAPRPPSELASVPAELDALCLRCLEKAPARRFRDMGELGAALDSLGEEPRRAGASALLVGAALLVALGVGALAAGGPPAEEAARASAAPSPSPSERAAPSATPGAGVPLIQRAERALGRGDFGEACRAASSARAPWLERLQVAQRLAVAAWEGGEAREIDLARGVAERLLRDAPLERRGSALLLQASFEAHEPPEEQDSAQVRQSAEQALDAGLSPGEEALARSILSRVLPAGAEAVANGVAWVRLAPRSEACLALGLALAELQEPGAAVPFLRRALAGELAPAAKGNALLQLGLGELRVGDFEQGLASLRAVCLLIDRGPQVASHLRLLAQAASACGRETEVMVELEPTVKRWADPLSQRSVKLFAAQSVLTTHPPNLEMAGGWLDQRPLAEEFAPLREWRADLELRRKLIMKKTHRERTYTELPALHFALALQDLAAGRVEDGTRRLLRHPQPLNDLRRFVAA